MYAETGLLYPYFQSYCQEFQSFEELCGLHKSNGSMSNLIPTSTILEYDLGGEGDLFKAPEPIIEEPVAAYDPVVSAIAMISCGEDVISSETINITDIDSMQSDSLLSEVFYECKKDLLANCALKEPFPEVDVTVPAIQMEDDLNLEKSSFAPQGSIYKSVSSGCLSSMEWISGSAARPNFLDFQGMDFSYGMRRAYSEGDIQTLSNGKTNLFHSPMERSLNIGNYAIEARLQKLSRYRKKKTKRNFGRTIKYACRKALADSQPRVRGRFAKTEESEIPKK
ncbi:Cct motif family protein [Thalictrum thalictroides]|uniref:Cct motif family protein n=1 Tax=Thalictrum thalictroides TaxID=46969 RepID=A0A7J6XBG9_THATH|nr:Cct motif family protein [Thalictrum thalictroides]